ncbi:MAG: C4-dicarboxylate ABC transporter permease [Woeseia sp.]|nr:C4-dicarboxylate ABC transporter permease [Woeseia sp.]|tara:strand:- start:144 stop:1424 length:1281 start_codon:yes stop_codon:yes gene_type:complete
MGLLLIVTLILTMLMGVPVGICLGITTVVGMLYISPDLLIMLPQKFISGLDSFPLLAIPLFVLAGQLMAQGGLAKRIVELSLIFVGQVRGGLGMVVIFATMLMSGISGSPAANTAAIGSIAVPEMKKQQYPTEFSTVLLAAAGGVSTLVPPAIDLIIIGVIANISISALFAAGILPAVLCGIGIMALAHRKAQNLELPLAEPMTEDEKRQTLFDGLLPLLMVVIILGGIYGGVFTPTEAAAVAVVYGFCVSFFIYKELKLTELPNVLLKSCALTGVVLLVLACAAMFSFLLTFEGIPLAMADMITTYAFNWIVFILFVHVLFFVLGMVMDCLPPILILMPILVPVASAMGIDPVHFGIIVAANVGLGMVSPPVGICLFVSCGLSGTPIERVVKPLLPFLLVLTISLMVITFVPQVSLFLPKLLGLS